MAKGEDLIILFIFKLNYIGGNMNGYNKYIVLV